MGQIDLKKSFVIIMAILDATKWKISALSGLVFLIVASPEMYNVLQSVGDVIGLELANADGCPNMLGHFVSSVIFMLIVRLMMR
jgi:hypothetical protein